MNTISISAASGRAPAEPRYQCIDVRSPGEYASGHIPGAVNIPMDQIEARLDDLLPAAPILLVCQAGKRARMVAGLLEPCRSDVTVLEGGTAAWAAAGLPLVTSVKSRFSLERQVRLIAGLTDICMMASLLIRMPWNQPRSARATDSAVNPQPCNL